ncbi:MAG: penicillin-binding protein 2, partial [Chloroflexi bacterium]|nr:penicillin-binding protein 2 [Chloroflexota bacterium]
MVLQLRFIAFRVFVVILFLILSGQLWKLQVVEGKRYQQKAERNRLRMMTVPSPRGVIYDRNKTLLVRNIPSFTVSVVPADLPKS